MFFHRSNVESDPTGSLIGKLLPLLILSLALLALSGCGGGGDEDSNEGVVLATVGDKDITADYYELKLGKLEHKELPQTDDGRIQDMSQLEGKKDFLETLINKELMARKATQLGYAADNQVAALKASMTSYEANLQLWNDVIGQPSSVISPEQLEGFYARMGEIRDCKYIITNFKDDAEAARKMAAEGADWDDVVAEYHDGAEPPSGEYDIAIPFGRYNMDFDTDVFETEIGDVAPPILTAYGYWVMKVVNVRETGKPDLEEAKAQILDITRNRMIAQTRKEFIEGVRESYKFFINEDALWAAFQALPPDEQMLDPETNQPTPKDELKPLDVKPADMDLIFYGYTMDGELKQYTVADYKNHFDRMSVFQRPKTGELLGGMRQKITQELDKALLNKEAEVRGFFEHPAVVEKVSSKVEEVMVTKLYEEVVSFDDRVDAETLDAFWKEHQAEYNLPESRNGRLVVCRNEATALEARAAIEKGMAWKQVLTRFGIDKDNKSRAGKLERVFATSKGALPEAMAVLAQGEISQPVELDNGRFGIVRVDGVEPGRQQTLSEVSETIGQRIRNQRREDSFKSLLAQWAEEFGVTRYEDRLAEVASWEELTRVELPGELIPRN